MKIFKLKSGISNFEKLVFSGIYIDKTILIKAFLEDENRKILITTPPRFCKTVNLDMIKQFVELKTFPWGIAIEYLTSSDLPEDDFFRKNDLAISKHPETITSHRAKYPVVYADFTCSDFKGTIKDALLSLKQVVSACFKRHQYLETSTMLSEEEQVNVSLWCLEKVIKRDATNGLAELCFYLYKHYGHRKVIVLIDNCDSLILKTMYNKNSNALLKHIITLTVRFLSVVGKSNTYVERAMITGNLYITSRLLVDETVKRCNFLGNHRYVPFYGMTAEEVRLLHSAIQPDEKVLKKVHSRFGGYFSVNGIEILNLWSIMCSITSGYINDYWRDSFVVNNLQEVMENRMFKESLELLLQCETVKLKLPSSFTAENLADLQAVLTNPVENQSLYFTTLLLLFLLDQGFLCMHSLKPKTASNIVFVKIPNKEAADELSEKMCQIYLRMILNF